MAVFRGAIIENVCAQFRHQRQKLRTQCAELLAEFRGSAPNIYPIPELSTLRREVYFYLWIF